jgi:coenzyme F420-0:L-glutamate ligase/coenzyme F420-1:gamma-L-glutamate ligase
MSLEIVPILGLSEVRPGDDLAALLLPALRGLGVGPGDVVVVTSKVVSKAEGRIVDALDRDAWIEREASRILARRGDLVIAETRHGFVCANAGVDTSNAEDGEALLLPEDPDASADRLRERLATALELDDADGLAVVITDTFGRPWRAGLVNVAIGVAGLPALVDLRGRPDDRGQPLDATMPALADEVAAASGLVMAKDARVPAALVRGVDRLGGTRGTGADLIRDPGEDLFRSSPLQAIHARRTIRSFGPGTVPRDALEEAIGAACTAPAPHHTRPWRFSVLTSAAAKRGLLTAMAAAWRTDLRADGVEDAVIERRIARSDAVLGQAPVLIVPWVGFAGSHSYRDAERSDAERMMFLLSGGAAIASLLLALHAQQLASCWISSTLFCQEETRAALGMDDDWIALGAVACGPMPSGPGPKPRPPIDVEGLATFH